jgi:hypothetical protein
LKHVSKNQNQTWHEARDLRLMVMHMLMLVSTMRLWVKPKLYFLGLYMTLLTFLFINYKIFRYLFLQYGIQGFGFHKNINQGFFEINFLFIDNLF